MLALSRTNDLLAIVTDHSILRALQEGQLIQLRRRQRGRVGKGVVFTTTPIA